MNIKLFLSISSFRKDFFVTVSLISSARVKLVRVGHPARLLPQVLDSALDAQVNSEKIDRRVGYLHL